MPAMLFGGGCVCFDASISGSDDVWLRKNAMLSGALIFYPKNKVPKIQNKVQGLLITIGGMLPRCFSRTKIFYCGACGD